VDWHAYLAVFRRRWWIIALIVGFSLLLGGYSFLKSYRSAGYQGCVTLYVADVSAPTQINAPSSTLETAGQLLAGETAANFFGDDILDVAQSADVARYVGKQLAPKHLPDSAVENIQGTVSGSRLDRTVNLCVANANATSALAAAQVLGTAMTSARADFIGAKMARRTFVKVISPASVAPVSKSRSLLNLALRIVLGLLVALGLALLWDAMDPTVRDRRDVESALGVPLLATFS
jgi:capsular polysaccharide biosynthesis protein